jgi:hypothetical protein
MSVVNAESLVSDRFCFLRVCILVAFTCSYNNSCSPCNDLILQSIQQRVFNDGEVMVAGKLWLPQGPYIPTPVVACKLTLKFPSRTN